jgi:hypothetical protein
MIKKPTDKGNNKLSLAKAQKASKDPNHDKLWRVNSLPPETKKRTDEMLRRHSPRTVAELQQEEGYNTDIQAVTLCHILEQYRREKIPADDLINPYMVEKLTARLKTNVNVFSEMSELISLQKERIRLARMEEIDGKLSQEVTKSLHLMGRLLKIYADMGIKAGLMGSFVNQFTRECQQDEEMEVFDVRNIFFKVLRGMVRIPAEADRHSDLMAIGIPAGSRPLFRSNPTGCL